MSRLFLRMLAGVVLLGLLAPAGAMEFSDGVDALSIDEARKELRLLPPEIRANMSQSQMALFLRNVLIDRRIEQAARAAGFAERPDVQERFAKAMRDILVRTYIDQETSKLQLDQPDERLLGLARERYELNKDKYQLPAAIRVAHILIKLDPDDPAASDAAARAKAEAILQKLRAGADFGELAKENSEDAGSARRRGELPGWQAKGRLVPAFEEAAYALKPGETSGLVRTRFGYHIIKLLEKNDARTLSFDEVKDQILAALRQELLSAKRADWMKRFEGKAPIVLDDATFEALKNP